MHELNLPEILNRASDTVSNLPAPLKQGGLQVLRRLAGAVLKRAERKTNRDDALQDALADAQAKLIARLGDAAGDMAVKDPELVKRALDTMLSESLRQQENREAVAANMADELATDRGGHDEGGEIDEDWLNIFSNHAANASTDKMRLLWGRVAAGEVRKPGSYSIRTLRFLAELDKPTADDFETFVSSTVADVTPRSDRWSSGEKFRLKTSLNEAGLVDVEPSVQRKVQMTDGTGYFWGDRLALQVDEPGLNEDLQVPILRLTRIGRELKAILPPPAEIEALSEVASLLKKQGRKFKICAIVRDGAKVHLVPIKEV